MKILAFFAVVVLCHSTGTACAQATRDSLVVVLRTGEGVTIAFNDIEKVTFDSTARAAVRTEEGNDNKLVLSQSFPNPASRETTIAYSLPSAGPVAIVIRDANGKEIRMLSEQNAKAGANELHWDGRTETGESVASGPYFYEVRFKGTTEVKNLIIVR